MGINMRVLITGSSGNIGSVIATHLANQYEVLGLDIVPGEFTTHVGDISDSILLDNLVANVDVVFHCAAFHAPHVGEVGDEKFWQVNVESTQLLLEKSLKYKIKRFIYTSTTSVYGCTQRTKNSAVWVDEQLTPSVEDIYDETKLAAEKACFDVSLAGLDVIVLRMSRCFPEADHLQVFYRLYRGVAAQDVACAHALAMHCKLEGFHIFNISGQTPFVKKDCQRLLHDPWTVIKNYFPNAQEMFKRNGWPLSTSIDRVYSIEKAVKILNYRPRENFIDILKVKSS